MACRSLKVLTQFVRGNITCFKMQALKMKEYIAECHSSLPKQISEHTGIARNPLTFFPILFISQT